MSDLEVTLIRGGGDVFGVRTIGTMLSWFRLPLGEPMVMGSDTYGSPAEARAALNELVSGRKAEGYREKDAVARVPTADADAPREEMAPSRTRKPKAKPTWFETLGPALQKQLAAYERKAKRLSLGHRFDEIAPLMFPGIDVVAKGRALKRSPSSGSYLGGVPQLPSAEPWPENDSGPLVFLGQIELGAQWTEADVLCRLPGAGVLAFFGALGPWESDASYGQGGAVVYVPPEEELESRPPPKEGCVLSAALRIVPKARLTLPHPFSRAVENLKLNEHESEAYHDQLFVPSQPEERKHHMLFGHPNHLVSQAGRKTHLLQIDSDRRIGLEVADVSPIRFYYGGGDLAQRRVRRKVLVTCSSDVA